MQRSAVLAHGRRRLRVPGARPGSSSLREEDHLSLPGPVLRKRSALTQAWTRPVCGEFPLF